MAKININASTVWGTIRANLNAMFTELYTTKADVTSIPITLPASDVSAWAKQGVKPSYSATEVGLANVNNTTDALKPVSTATQTALNLKVNASGAKVLSDVNYTQGEKDKLAAISTVIVTATPSAYDIDLSSADDFTKTCTGASAFTISNPIIKKPFRLILTGGTLSATLFTGYTSNWILGSVITTYNAAITNYLWCEVRAAGQIYLFWGA